jgi:hypothetical protein
MVIDMDMRTHRLSINTSAKEKGKSGITNRHIFSSPLFQKKETYIFFPRKNIFLQGNKK